MFILIAVGSLVLQMGVMTVLLFVYPQAFSLATDANPPTASGGGADSTKAAATGKDTLTAPRADGQPVQRISSDSVMAHARTAAADSALRAMRQANDSLKTALHRLADVGVKVPAASAPRSDTLTEQETKKMVEIFESMEAESAARILNNMDDFAIKQILTAMKRRQSAKILAVLEPRQAARILKEKISQ